MTILSLNTVANLAAARDDNDEPMAFDAEAGDADQPATGAPLQGASGLADAIERMLGVSAQLHSLNLNARYDPAGGSSNHAANSTGAACHVAPTKLEYGDRGPEVKSLQHDLNKWRAANGMTPPLAEDGIFGPKTKRPSKSSSAQTRRSTPARALSAPAEPPTRAHRTGCASRTTRGSRN
jgi:hypothetical protein